MRATEAAALDPAAIDALYGLEPVIEPQAPAGQGGTAPATVDCPYCGEPFETTVDLSAGASVYVEDCQVCCRPIEIAVDVGDDGTLDGLRAARLD